MGGMLYTADDGGLLHFVLITLAIGGVLAWQTGRALASTWSGFAMVPLYMLLLAAGVRFLHYALGGEDLLDVRYYVVELVFLCSAAGYGYRSRRAEQMSTQYSWLYDRSGPVGWTAKS